MDRPRRTRKQVDYSEVQKEESKKKPIKKEQEVYVQSTDERPSAGTIVHEKLKKTKGRASRQKGETVEENTVDVSAVLKEAQNRGASENKEEKIVDEKRDSKPSKRKNSKKAKVLHADELSGTKIPSSPKGKESHFEEEVKENDIACLKPAKQSKRKGKKSGKRNKTAEKRIDEAEKPLDSKSPNNENTDEQTIIPDDDGTADVPQIPDTEIVNRNADVHTCATGATDKNLEDKETMKTFDTLSNTDEQTLVHGDGDVVDGPGITDIETNQRIAADSTFTIEEKNENSETKKKLEKLTTLLEALSGRVKALEQERNDLKNMNEVVISKVTSCMEEFLAVTQKQEERLQNFEEQLDSLKNNGNVLNQELITIKQEDDLFQNAETGPESNQSQQRGNNCGTVEIIDSDAEELLMEVNMLNDFCMKQKRLIRKLQNIMDGTMTKS